MPQAVILVVEDDEKISRMVRDILEHSHYAVSVAGSVLQAQSLLRKAKPDLIILDRHLPDKDGIELCRQLRAAPDTSGLPILFLTSLKSVTDKVLGLQGGGDDYLAKPFEPLELIARVQALLRRTAPQEGPAGALAWGPVRMEIESRTVHVGAKKVDLTNREFELLKALLERGERVLTRQFLLANVWGYDLEVELTGKAVDMAVMCLRRKLGRAGEVIEAVPGHGYKLRSREELK